MHGDSKALEQALVYVHSVMLSCCGVQNMQAVHKPFCFQDCGANAWQCAVHARMHGDTGRHVCGSHAEAISVRIHRLS